jgi:hypothetical protein
VWRGCSRRKSASGRTTGLFIDREGVIQETEDPSSFPPLLGGLDIYLLRRGAASTTPSSATLLSNTRKLQRSYPREIGSGPERSGGLLIRWALSRGRIVALGERHLVTPDWLDASQRAAWCLGSRWFEQSA